MRLREHPVAILKRKLKESPRASEKEIHDAVREACSTHQMTIIFDYWFSNVYRSFRVEVEKGSVAVMRQYRDIRVEARRVRVTAIKEKLEMDIMDHCLSNGKLLRNATFGEVAQEGGWMAELSKYGKPNEVVGKHLTSQQIINIKMRNEPRRRKAG